MRFFILTRKGLLSVFVCFIIGVFALTIATGTLTQAVQTSTTSRLIPIYYVDTNDKVCALSFDAAWGNEQTQTLLDTLDKYNVKTTFFLVGEWVDKYPESVKEIYSRGHDIGNHSDTHAHMSQISQNEQIEEIKNCNEKITAITGSEVTLFRPPYGEYDNNVVNSVLDSDMYCVQWNIDSLDWKDPSPQEMVQRIESKLCEGSIILLHNGATNTPDALPLIIEAIHAQGYKIVPVSEILLKGEYTTDVQGMMINTTESST